MSSSFEFFDVGSAPVDLIDDEETGRFLDPGTFCTAGSVSATLNGNPVVADQTPPLKGTLAATFNGCSSRVNSSSTYSGSSEVQFDVDSFVETGAPGRSSLQLKLKQMGKQEREGTQVKRSHVGNGNGTQEWQRTGSGAALVELVTYTPSPGSTLRDELGDLTATFNSGSTSSKVEGSGTSTKTSVTYNKLNLTVSGVTYMANGSYQIGGSNPGEVLVTTVDGAKVGRIYFDVTKGPVIEADGAVTPLVD